MTVCWCGQTYIRGVCPLHGVMRDPRSYGGGSTVINEGDTIQQAPLGYLESVLPAAVTLTTSNTFYPTVLTSAPSLVLTRGTWLVAFHVTLSRTATTLATYFARIWDGTTVYASGQASHPSQNPHYVQMHLTTVIPVATSLTVQGQGASNAGSATSLMRYSLSLAATTQANVTKLTAVRIG
jgi:hypothetical protein